MDRPANDVVPIRQTHRRAWFGAAAVVVAALAVVGGLLISGGARDNVVARATLSNDGLSPLGSASSGKAKIIRRGGSYLLRLDVSRLPQEPSSYIEVWLIDSQVKGMVSLGPFHGNGNYLDPFGCRPGQVPHRRRIDRAVRRCADAQRCQHRARCGCGVMSRRSPASADNCSEAPMIVASETTT